MSIVEIKSFLEGREGFLLCVQSSLFIQGLSVVTYIILSESTSFSFIRLLLPLISYFTSTLLHNSISQIECLLEAREGEIQDELEFHLVSLQLS